MALYFVRLGKQKGSLNVFVLYNMVESGTMHSKRSLGEIARVFSSWYDEGKLCEANYEITGKLADVCFVHDFDVEEVSSCFFSLLLFVCFLFRLYAFPIFFLILFILFLLGLIVLSSTIRNYSYFIPFWIDVKPHLAKDVISENLIKFYYIYSLLSSG
jgi:hypothetical protein